MIISSPEETKKTRSLSHVCSRAWHPLFAFALSSDWLIVLIASAVIGQSDYFDFGFTTALIHIFHDLSSWGLSDILAIG